MYNGAKKVFNYFYLKLIFQQNFVKQKIECDLIYKAELSVCDDTTDNSKQYVHILVNRVKFQRIIYFLNNFVDD